MARRMLAVAVVLGSMICLSASSAEAAGYRVGGTVAGVGPYGRPGVAHGHVAVRGVGVGLPGATVVARGGVAGPYGAAGKTVRVRY